MKDFTEKICYHGPDEESSDESNEDWSQEDPDGGGYDDHDVEIPDAPSGYGVAE